MAINGDASDSPDVDSKPVALIVDDCSTSCKIHATLAKMLGFDTITVENGRIAVDLYRFGAHYDLVLMDLYMPVMNGLEAIQELRRMGLRCKILGVTASDRERDLQAFIEAGADASLVKPLTLADLESALAADDN